MGRPAVFLDRDGVLNIDTGYVYKKSDLRLMPFVIEGLNAFSHLGFMLVVISNQSGVARGYFEVSDVEIFNQSLRSAIVEAGGPTLDGFYYCPHHPEGVVNEYRKICTCRKPESGMVVTAVEHLSIDLPKSLFIGDRFDDIECAKRLGIPGIQVRSKRFPKIHPNAHLVVDDLLQAANEILKNRDLPVF